MSDVVCPQCSKKVTRHCDHCGWLVCVPCEVTYGRNNYVRVKKRQNGI
jgi:hypothetical protein